MTVANNELPKGPLSGLRILEMGHFIAAPFCTRMLGDLGAEIIKIESPGAGDPVRTWGRRVDGKSVWWSVHGRNKKSITLNLKSAKGLDVAKKLIGACDAVVENYRPGQLDRWGLGEEVIQEINPECIVVHVSGYGQTGPGKDRAAFGVIGEAVGGLRHLTGYPAGMSDLPPSRTGVSLGDMVAGMYAAIGLLSSLYERQSQSNSSGQAPGRSVDVALTEAVFSLLEGCLPEYGLLGEVREPAGGALPVSAPSNAYPSKDGRWVIIAANSDALYHRLMKVIDRPDIAEDENFNTNPGRVARMADLDAAIADWTKTLPAKEAERILAEADIPSTLIYTIEDIARDKQFLARDMIIPVEDQTFGETLHPGIIPKLSGQNAGGISWAGPDVGQHTTHVLADVLGMSSNEIETLKKEGAI